VANQTQLDRTFAACAHPIRRGIIERLGAREMTVGEATQGCAVSKPSISKHLRVLEHALEDAQKWMSDQRAMWERKFDVIEDYLTEQRAQRGNDTTRSAGGAV
jgi:DNA-binding transcriptional ArsR family regulator